jgi:prevent-host-death family protein
MTLVTIHQAKTNLSKLIAEVEAGGEVVIARGKTPAVKLVVADQPKPLVKRQAGLWKGRPGFGFSESFFDPLPEDELALWEGRDD